MAEDIVTAIGTSNIALIKYWGKRDERLILPTNSSISMTLDERLSAMTSVVFSGRLKKDAFYLNGALQDLNDKEIGEKFQIINYIRKLANAKEPILVVSENNFPTAAGLASSAAGTATLVYAAANALGLDLPVRELSIIVRQSSGSACRSVAGGFVRWNVGKEPDGRDSFAEQIAGKDHWPEMNDVIAVVDEKRKKVSSRSGMKQTMQTSGLYKARPALAEGLARDMADAIAKKDFERLAEITMKDSNNLHATMLDTYPPIMYLNDVSKEIIGTIHQLNESEGRLVAAYTFDAGPNAHIMVLDRHRGKVMDSLKGVGGIARFIEAKPGSGPRILDNKESLIDEGKMAPKSSK